MATTDLSSLVAPFVQYAWRVLRDGGNNVLSDNDLQAVLTAAIKLYAARAEDTQHCPSPLIAHDVSTTEVVVVASEMLRVLDLSPFDLSMWYRRA